MSGARRWLMSNLNLWPHAIHMPGGWGHRSCLEILARGLRHGTLAFDDAGLPMISLRSVSTRRRAGIRTRVRGFADRYLNHSVTRRS